MRMAATRRSTSLTHCSKGRRDDSNPSDACEEETRKGKGEEKGSKRESFRKIRGERKGKERRITKRAMIGRWKTWKKRWRGRQDGVEESSQLSTIDWRSRLRSTSPRLLFRSLTARRERRVTMTPRKSKRWSPADRRSRGPIPGRSRSSRDDLFFQPAGGGGGISAYTSDLPPSRSHLDPLLPPIIHRRGLPSFQILPSRFYQINIRIISRIQVIFITNNIFPLVK